MAKIVYGVSGEGSGHSSRAREMIRHLEQLGHTVKVASYDRGYNNLEPDFDVFEIEGLHTASSDNRVSKVKTFTDNLQRLSQGHKKLQALRKNIFKQFPASFQVIDSKKNALSMLLLFLCPLIWKIAMCAFYLCHFDYTE